MATPEDFWTMNGSTTFAWMPAGIINGVVDRLPICLQRGTPKWGEEHIKIRHARFITQNTVGSVKGHGVPWLLWKKLSQSGNIWTAEVDEKVKIALTLTPNVLLLVKYIDADNPFFSVTTMFTNNSSLDGIKIARYQGTRWLGQAPIFDLPP